MDNKLFQLVANQIPPINREIAEGLAVKEMRFVERYVDSIIRCAEQDFPEGLVYKEYRRLTPLDEFIKATEPKGTRGSFDVARNDVYMIALEFEFKGERIIKPLYLPFVRAAGILALRGSTFAISPVLADKGISLGASDAFVQIPKARITFKRTPHHYIADGVRKSPYIVHSWLHNRDRKSAIAAGKPIVTMETSLIHYLFCKYGVLETFKRFCRTEIKIGYVKDLQEEYGGSDDWVVCNSMGLKPRGVRNRFYQPTEIGIAIRECDFDSVTDSMIGSFFYVVDHFTNRVEPEYLDGSVDELRLWRILLGLIIGGITGGEGSVSEAMNEHMDSLDSYIDARAKSDLQGGDIFVDDIYQLLMYVMEVLSQMVVQSSDTISTMYDKQFMVLRYVLRDVSEGVFRMLFKLKKTALKKELNATDVSKIIRMQLSTDAVLRMNNSGKHGEVSSVSSPGDNMFFKITANIILQTDSGGNPKSTKSGKPDASKLLHASIAEVGSFTVLPKAEPTGRTRVNPWVKMDDHGAVLRDPKIRDIIDSVQNKIKRDS